MAVTDTKVPYAMTETRSTLPKTQYAVQLVGPSELKLNRAKTVPQPRAHEILAKIEAVGLCFSDLKLLKQFDAHARKSEVIGGLGRDVLSEIQSYVPGKTPAVPGHEAVIRIIAVGRKVTRHKVGERCLVQTDYRELPTASSNAAFGYNFEGALQQYVILDERVVIDSTGQRFLIPVSEQGSASAVALIEPWACVEDSYVNPERRTIKAGGGLLVVTAAGHTAQGVAESYSDEGEPADVTTLRDANSDELAALPDEGFDDIVYFGADKQVIEILNDKLAPRGIMNVVLGGQKISEPVNVGIGRVHYGMTRWVGTAGSDASVSYKTIPATGEIRPGEKIVVIGAGGPMGQMHVIRDVCSGVKNIEVVGTDFDDQRLRVIEQKAAPLAAANGAKLRIVNTQKTPLAERFSYFALMAPVPALVAQAVKDASEGALINIFAGIPAPTKQQIDLDAYIARRCFMFGTSGSVIEDMKIVLRKVESGRLDTNCSIDAISGMAGAADGIAAVENRTLAGKIIVYPDLPEVGLIRLEELGEHYPTVAAKLRDGQWCLEAEQELLEVAASK